MRITDYKLLQSQLPNKVLNFWRIRGSESSGRSKTEDVLHTAEAVHGETQTANFDL